MNIAETSFVSFIKAPVNDNFVEVLESKVRLVIKPENISAYPVTPTQSSATLNLNSDAGKNPEQLSFLPGSTFSLNSFIKTLIVKSKVRPATLFGTMVYLNRLKNKLPPTASGFEFSYFRIFLAALIISGKSLNDSSPKNKHWSLYSKIFTQPQVNKMEMQFLQFLNYNLRISMPDLLFEFNDFRSQEYNFSHIPGLKLSPLTPNFPNTPLSGVFHGCQSYSNHPQVTAKGGACTEKYNPIPRLQMINNKLKYNCFNTGMDFSSEESNSRLYRRRKLGKKNKNSVTINPIKANVKHTSRSLLSAPLTRDVCNRNCISQNYLNLYKIPRYQHKYSENIQPDYCNGPEWYDDMKLPPIRRVDI